MSSEGGTKASETLRTTSGTSVSILSGLKVKSMSDSEQVEDSCRQIQLGVDC
jgi:hypothetical protein